MRIASLDLGSNTFLMLIADWDGPSLRQVISDEVRMVRLAEGLSATGKISAAALSRAEACLQDFARKGRELKVDRFIAVTTSAARDASNRDEFLQLGSKFGISISLLSGEDEALATFLGAAGGGSARDGTAVIDVGGGSTEIIGTDAGGNPKGVSVNIGAVRMTERFLSHHPCSALEIRQMEDFIRASLAQEQDELPQGTKKVIAVAGTPTSLVTLELGRSFVESEVEGFEMPIATIWKWRDKLALISVAEREALAGMPKGRGDVLVAGATILGRTCEVLGVDKIIVSARGVRYGLVPMLIKSEGISK